jgi:hypothetical protein
MGERLQFPLGTVLKVVVVTSWLPRARVNLAVEY